MTKNPSYEALEQRLFKLERELLHLKQREPDEKHQWLKFLSETAMELIEFPFEENLLDFAANKIKELAADSIVGVLTFNVETKNIYLERLVGIGKFANAVMRILGRDPVGMFFKLDDEAVRELTKSKLVEVPGGISGLSPGVPKNVWRALESALGLGKAYSIGFSWNGNLFGNATLLLPKGHTIKNQFAIETLIRQISVALLRRQAEEKVRETYDKLEELVKERTTNLGETNEKLKLEIEGHKQAKKALESSKHRYHTLINTMNEGLVEVDEEWNMTFINKRFADMLGLNRDQIIGRRFHELASEAYKEKAQEEHTRRRQGEVGNYELELVKADGERIFVFCSPKPFYNSEGNYLGGLGVVADITERKKAEEALRESEEKYRSILENIQEGYYEVDLSGNFVFFNKSFLNISGYSKNELAGASYRQYTDPKDIQKVFETFNKVYVTRKTVDRLYWEILRKDGAIRSIEVSVVLRRDSEGHRVGFQGMIRDITELKLAEKKRKRLEAQLQQTSKMEAIGTLAGGIAHEFNNALMGIMGNIELLKMDLPKDERRDRHFEAMRGSGHRMASLTSQLLAYARGGKYQPKNLKLDDFVIETLPILKHNLRSTIRMETHFQKDILCITADHPQMQMVLSAILANSNEAIEDDGFIRITAENKVIDVNFIEQHPGLKPGPYACLTIEDDGKGMDAETRNCIFEPFFTTKFQGRGMGMAAVYGIVMNHDGWISVDSELGKGTAVRIYLPVRKKEVEKPRTPETEIVKGSGTILMIEDEDVVIEVTQAMLEWLDYRVMVAKTGKDAVHITETFDGNIDLTLLDIKLPDMEGGKVYPLIMEARPDLKVIIFSGYAIDGPARKILDAGAEDFIQRPFSLATLSEKLKAVIEGR